MKSFKAVAAMSLNRVIGHAGKIPWHIPEEFAWFKRLTMGHVLVMGRRTFMSIGRALPGREIIVLSRTGFTHPGVRTVSSLDEIDPSTEKREVFICGGAEVYAAALPRCSDLYLTIVEVVVEGDAFFPPFEHLFDEGMLVFQGPGFKVWHHKHKTKSLRCNGN